MRYVVRSTGQDLDQMMDAVFGGTRQAAVRTPAVDVWEEENRYVLEIELPGLRREDIDVRVEDNLLTVSSRGNEEAAGAEDTGQADQEAAQTEGRKWVLRERRHGGFVRSFSLPKDVDTSAIEARAHDGVLTLSIGKAEQARPRHIEIKSE